MIVSATQYAQALPKLETPELPISSKSDTNVSAREAILEIA